MKNPTKKTLDKALAMHADGAQIKAIIKETGLNYTQTWRFLTSRDLEAQGFEFLTTVDPARCEAMRAEGLSWGAIAVRHRLTPEHNTFGAPEGQVRKAFETATGLKSQGQRIGKGGRFFYGDRGAPLYAAELRPTGTDIPKEAKYDGAIQAAQDQRLIHRDLEDLKARATELGVSLKSGSKNKTKAKLVTDILKAEKAQAAKVAEPVEG